MDKILHEQRRQTLQAIMYLHQHINLCLICIKTEMRAILSSSGKWLPVYIFENIRQKKILWVEDIY